MPTLSEVHSLILDTQVLIKDSLEFALTINVEDVGRYLRYIAMLSEALDKVTEWHDYVLNYELATAPAPIKFMRATNAAFLLTDAAERMHDCHGDYMEAGLERLRGE